MKKQKEQMSTKQLLLYGAGITGISVWLLWIPFIGIPLLLLGFLMMFVGLLYGLVAKPLLKLMDRYPETIFWSKARADRFKKRMSVSVNNKS